MTESSDQSEAIEQPTAVPRPGVGHLLLWISCCAVGFGLRRALVDLDGAGHPVLRAIDFFGLSVLLGTALFGFVLGCRWAVIRKYNFPNSALEWMLFIVGPHLFTMVFLHLLGLRHSDPLFVSATALVTGVLFLMPIVLGQFSRRWKRVFAIYASLCLILGASLLSAMPHPALVVPRQLIGVSSGLHLSLLLLLIEAVAHWRTQRWTYWLACGLTVYWIVYYLAYPLQPTVFLPLDLV